MPGGVALGSTGVLSVWDELCPVGVFGERPPVWDGRLQGLGWLHAGFRPSLPMVRMPAAKVSHPLRGECSVRMQGTLKAG
jgi:hypothetical protein